MVTGDDLSDDENPPAGSVTGTRRKISIKKVK